MKDSSKYLSTESLMLGLMANMSSYDVKFISGDNPYTIRVDGEDVYVYIKNLSPAQLSNKNPDIWRIQLPVKEDFKQIKNSDSLFILLGYDTENDIYTSWNPFWCKQRLNVGKSVSLYSRYSLQQRIHESGQIEKMSLNNESEVVCFPAKLLYHYIKTVKEYFPEESLYIAKGSRINKRIITDPQALFDLFVSFDDCSKFEAYMRNNGMSGKAINDYVRNLRAFQKNGFFAKHKEIFLRCSSIDDYDLAVKEFRNQPDILAIDAKNHGYLRAALWHYVKFMKTLFSVTDDEPALFDQSKEMWKRPYELDSFGKLIELDPALTEQLLPHVIGEDYPDYDEMINIAIQFYPQEIDDNMAYSDWISLFKQTNWKKKRVRKPEYHDDEISVQKRNQKLRVTWPDGHSMQTRRPSDTFVFIIENNYPDLIMEMKFKRDVISKDPFPDYPGSKRSQQYLKSGYWVNTNIGLPEKAAILQQISAELDLGLKIEIVSEEVNHSDYLAHEDQPLTECLIVQDKSLNRFVYKVILLVNKEDRLSSFIPYLRKLGSNSIQLFKENSFRLTGMFICTNIEEINLRNKFTTRWYDTPFTINGKEMYLSTQWYGNGEYSLMYSDFQNLIITCYGNNFRFAFDENDGFQLWKKQ